MRKLFIALGIATAIGLTAVTPASAADLLSGRPLDRSTVLTFSGPVALPTVTLPAGSYLFRFVDAATIGPTVLQVMDKDGKISYAMLHTVPIVRTNANDESQITFKETKDNAPVRIGAWFFEGTEGCELTYAEAK